MKRYGKWKPLRPLGEGGQGMVVLAHDSDRLDLEGTSAEISRVILDLSPTSYRQVHASNAEKLAQLVLKYGKAEDPEYCGALKVLHKDRDHPGYDKQLARLSNEVRGLSETGHPNLIRILDQQLKEGWFVMEYFPKGPLSKYPDLYRGNMVSALSVFRPLVEAVSVMHQKGLVHRDIKPENIFIKRNGNLVLGDLGLVYFSDQEKNRVTDTVENVGSRDWMPGWAMGLRVAEVSPAFDVFSLGKLLWSMISGMPKLQLWYHHKPQFEVEAMFPQNRDARWARIILDQCIVENEEDCIINATELLRLVDQVLGAVRHNAQVVGEGITRACHVCGLGEYRYLVNENQTATHNFGLQPTGTSKFKIFTCNYCGHVEMFFCPGHKPAAWD